MALTGARIVTMAAADGGVIDDGVIVVQGDRITAVGKRGAVSIPAGSKTVRLNSIAHLDLKTGKRQVYELTNGDATSEPVFTPRSATAEEGNGWVPAVVYRAGDQIGAWSFALVASLIGGNFEIAVVAMALAALWLVNALWLGRRQEVLEKAREN